MQLWQFFVVAGTIFLIIEMLFPVTFFLNFAIGAFITAILSVFFHNWTILVSVFLASSVTLLILFRPFLTKHTNVSAKESKTGLEGQYIDQVVKTITPVTKFSGAVTIYGERWEARLLDNSNISELPVGSEVKIIKNESLILYVEKI